MTQEQRAFFEHVLRKCGVESMAAREEIESDEEPPKKKRKPTKEEKDAEELALQFPHLFKPFEPPKTPKERDI